MSEANIELLRRAYDAFAKGDLDASIKDIAPNATYVTTGIPGVPQEGRGPEGYKHAIKWITEWFDNPDIKARDFRSAGDKVFAEFTLSGCGKRSGVPTSVTFWQVWTVEEGKFVHGQGFRTRSDALEAAGLSE